MEKKALKFYYTVPMNSAALYINKVQISPIFKNKIMVILIFKHIVVGLEVFKLNLDL